jgi:YD repeat-containing protein
VETSSQETGDCVTETGRHDPSQIIAVRREPGGYLCAGLVLYGANKMIKMLFLTVALFAPTAMAQSLTPSPPTTRTMTIKSPEGQIVGTATTSGNTIYYRDGKGELTGTAKIATDGSRTLYDPSGKVMGITSVSGNVATTRNPDGNIISTTTRDADGTTTTRDAKGNVMASGKEEQGR